VGHGLVGRPLRRRRRSGRPRLTVLNPPAPVTHPGGGGRRDSGRVPDRTRRCCGSRSTTPWPPPTCCAAARGPSVARRANVRQCVMSATRNRRELSRPGIDGGSHPTGGSEARRHRGSTRTSCASGRRGWRSRRGVTHRSGRGVGADRQTAGDQPGDVAELGGPGRDRRRPTRRHNQRRGGADRGGGAGDRELRGDLAFELGGQPIPKSARRTRTRFLVVVSVPGRVDAGRRLTANWHKHLTNALHRWPPGYRPRQRQNWRVNLSPAMTA